MNAARLVLHAHRATPCGCANALTVDVHRRGPDLLTLTFRIDGRVDRLQLPDRRPAEHTDGLWCSTCFEAFLRLPGERGYVEINLSPSSQWAAYRFDDYRRGVRPVTPAKPPEIEVRGLGQGLQADARIHLAGILPAEGVDLEIAVTAVLQDRTGALSYWAVSHPAGAADFHDPRGFRLTLPPLPPGAASARPDGDGP